MGISVFRMQCHIRQKVLGHVVYIKGLKKQTFLQHYLPYVVQLDMVPSFKKLNVCPTEWCEHRHGCHCARRKVHELKRYIDSNNIQLN